MESKKVFVFVMCILMLSTTVTMAGGIPDYPECSAVMPNGGGMALVLFSLPDGSGNSFAHAQLLDHGAEVDATIIFNLEDAYGVPIIDFPAEDMWLESADGGLFSCPGGSIADQNTDEVGYTTWSNPLRVGGFGTGGCEIFVSGVSMDCSGLPFDLTFNSADINGDGIVNLADVGIFSGHFFDDSSYDLSTDFFADGVMNLSDVGRLASGVGASCP